MSATFRSRNAQRGLALIMLLAVVVLAFSYVLVSRLPIATLRTAEKREHNARVLNQAKQALIGWMVINAAQDDDNPGRLPCPEGVNNIGTSQEGIAAPYPGDPGPPVVPGSPTCAAVGRLPWRTLGLEKLVDADAEPLWYTVSPGWALQNTSTTLTINSDKRGQMTVDGQLPPNDVVALIIAPGRAMKVQAAPNCTPRNQARAAPAPTMNSADYVECFSAGIAKFSTRGPATSFNDQVLAVTAADVIPILEAAIQQRMQREIAPQLRTVYASASWGQAAANPVYPYAARFDNPDPGSGNSYRGEDARYQGLLPFNCSATGCASDSRFSPTFVNWTASGPSPSISRTGPGLVASTGSCSVTGNQIQCTGTYLAVGTVTFTVTGARAINVAMALRQLDPGGVTLLTGSVSSLGTCTVAGTVTGVSATMQDDGSAILTIQAQAPGLLGGGGLPLTVSYCLTAQLGVLKDHPLLDRADPTTGWFVRNEWYRLVWYQVARRNTVKDLSLGSPVGTPPDCIAPPFGSPAPPTSSQCLGFNTAQNLRALLVLTGRSLSNPPAGRPNANLADYLEWDNCDPDVSGACTLGITYAQRWVKPAMRIPGGTPVVRAPFNDRLVLVDWKGTAPTFPIEVLP